ncbi:MAG: 4'-phosphopantetheinyl transferase superfamily protein [Ardenticatenaceae bacterium]|nr:4'-phosphopantetheinyl transferase superfamily protein [Ardenticatenaceae bacterium]
MVINFSDWQTPPTTLELPPGHLHIWRVPQDVDEAALARYWPILAADEQARANRFHFARDKNRYVVARAVLRLLIGRYLSRPPEQISFTYSEYDKPSIPGQRLQFNVSHSGGLALIAFCLDAEVGIDVEQKRPLIDADQIAERFFSAAEVAVFKSLPQEQRVEAFFNCWTRKEAYIKAIGEGLSCPLDVFDVTLAPGEPAWLLRIRGSEAAAAEWSLFSLEPAEGFGAAVAIPGRNWQLSCWDWPSVN